MFEELRKQCVISLEEKIESLTYEIVGAVNSSDFPYAKSLADRRAAFTECLSLISKLFKKFEEAEDGA